MSSEQPTAFDYLTRGRLLLRQGLLDRAIEDFDAAVALDDTLAAGYYCRGLAYRDGGDL
ncbi:MAG: tetratricopeptide repeat protein, partial [Chloroflexi bacterium]|nr:tetratricopeptide repeat protein [Chloroflexota bacterium]MCI0879177.1 tetratricopeptide repeat protein [Chloroflexota bacterium]